MQTNLAINTHDNLSLKMQIGILSGIFLEYFDYTLYGFSAPFIAKSFFPVEHPLVEQLLTWAVFAISFLLRPVGAILFGHFADKFGRRHILIITILMMCFATIGIGILPSYHQVGIIASIGLIICRILQGLAVSTEYTGCSTYLLEFKKKRQGLISGITTSASGFGIFCASLLVLFFNSLSKDFLFFSNWRWPFIFAGVIVGVLGLYFRLNLLESPAYLELKQRNQLARIPLLRLLQQSPFSLIRCIIISAYAGIAIIINEIYLPTFLQHHFGIQKENALQLSTYLAFLEACFAIGWGAFSDYLGRYRTLMFAGFSMTICIYPLLYLFHLELVYIWFIAATLLAIIVAAVDGPMAAFLVNRFPTATRYTAVSVSYNFGAAVFGGLSPVLIIALQNHLSAIYAVSGFLIISALIMLTTLQWER